MAPARIPSNVIFEVLEGEAVLLEMKSGTYYRLNPTGTRVWQLLEAGSGIDQIVGTIAEEFDAPEERIRADVDTVIDDLVENGLLDRTA